MKKKDSRLYCLVFVLCYGIIHARKDPSLLPWPHPPFPHILSLFPSPLTLSPLNWLLKIFSSGSRKSLFTSNVKISLGSLMEPHSHLPNLMKPLINLLLPTLFGNNRTRLSWASSFSLYLNALSLMFWMPLPPIKYGLPWRNSLWQSLKHVSCKFNISSRHWRKVLIPLQRVTKG